ncbi:hypothetical protein MIU24_02620 [Streptomyces venezuelae]|uniref:hypothetical protein n=1 Tax=Streptomyces sp. B6(2022) TaxID=3404749 RepID=UPI00311EEA59
MPDSNPPPLEYPGLSDFIDDIIEDLRRHPIGIDHVSVSTVTRHISQVSALLSRIADEAHAHSDHARRHPEPSIWRPTHILSMTTVSLAEADHVAIRLAMVEDGAQHMTAELRELAPSLKTRRPSTPVQAVRLPPIPSATSGPTRH